MWLQGSLVRIGMKDIVKLHNCPHHYRLVRILFRAGAHFMLAARRSDGMWVYTDSDCAVEIMLLQQLVQWQGHLVVGALLITDHQPAGDDRTLLADYLRQKQQASELAR